MLSNLKISAKLALAFGIVILLSMGMAAIALYKNQQVEGEWRRFERVTLAKRSAVTASVIALGNGVHHFKNFLLRGGDYDKKFLTDMEQVDQVAKTYDAITEISSEERQLLDVILAGTRTYRDAIAKLAESRQANMSIPEMDRSIKGADKPVAEALERLIAINTKASLEQSTRFATELSEARSEILVNSVMIVLVAIGLTLFIIRLITVPVGKVVDAAEQLAKGNLTLTFNIESKDEMGHMLHAVKNTSVALSNVMQEIDYCSKYMGQSAFQVAKISNEIAEVSRQQESRSNEVNQAMSMLHEISSDVSVRGSNAVNLSRQVEAMAQEGIASVRGNIRSMEETTEQVNRSSGEVRELEQAAQQIYSIANTIKDIAGQTNLLALNAAIEAARAGEQGRGFAVVADEVRKLAERTTTSATEVGEIIGTLSSKVQLVAETMNVVVEKVRVTQDEAGKTAETIEKIASNAVETAQANQGISDISRQQLEQFSLLESTLKTLFVILQESAAKTTVSATIGEDLRMVTERLNRIVQGFTFVSASHLEVVEHDKRRAPRVHNSLLVKASQGAVQLDGVSSDFSMVGLRLRLPAKIDEQQPLSLQIILPDDDLNHYSRQEPIQIKARVAWQREQEGRYVCGVEFIQVDEPRRKALQACYDFFHKTASY